MIYSVKSRDDNRSKQGKITVVDQLNRTVEKVIDIVFTPLDDISGRVRDRFEGTYLRRIEAGRRDAGSFHRMGGGNNRHGDGEGPL